MDILGLIRRLPEIVAYNKFDDDFFDRLNYSHTVAILTVFAIIVTNRQFSENQIKCWVPAQFTGSYEQYVNQICFITNTYSQDMHEPLKNDINNRHEQELKYYQWTPFILLLMAILFYIPHQLWRGLSLRSGVDLKDLVEAAQTYRSSNIRQDDKIKLLDYLTNWLNGYCSNAYRLTTLRAKKHYVSRKAQLIRIGHHIFFPIGIYTGNYLIISYLFVKILYLFNSIGQILLLNTLLGRQFWYYGIEIIHRYWTKQIGLLYSGNEYFPKVVLCDFTIREPNHPKESHRYTVQCVLPFNLFNQQIFTYLYFWLLILSCFNTASILIWLYRMSPYTNYHYLERRLTVHFLTHEHTNEQELRRIFVYQYLQSDGTFMLRLLSANVSDYVCTKIILELYKKFRIALFADKIGRESIFKPIKKSNSEDEKDSNNNDNESTDQTITADLPPIPNPRQGKISIERDTLSHLSSDMTFSKQPESQKGVCFTLPTTVGNDGIRLRSSPTPLLKDIRHTSNTQNDSLDRSTSHHKSVEFQMNSETTSVSTPTPLSTPSHPLLSAPSIPKGPSPYATTYLSTNKRNEHELPYIDDSNSSSSTSGRFANNTVARQTQTSTTILTSTNPFYQRSHDV
ncbi:unnamed protein product [Adineta steineri]|uniref:Innexin n=1 Tax=Adineta steineri TaxID=433720 RepID=A0A818L0J1_9BILA|nr:unnamed protein product [Adineta steineri]